MTAMTPEIAEEYRRIHQHYGWIAEREADAMNRLDLARPMLAAMPFAAEIDYAKLPDSLGIERWIDIENQGALGSCAAHAMTSCAEVAYYHATGEELQFNRLWQYLRAQYLDGIVGDSGSVVSSNCQVAQEIGQPLQGLWEYKAVYPRGGWPRWQADNSALAAKLEADAAARKIRAWKPLKNYVETLAWIAAKVGGVNIGIPWGDAMTPDAKGRVERYYRTFRDGGHSVALLDWNKQIVDEKGRPYIQLFNSWGKQWGLRGTCFVRPAIIDEWCQSQTVIGVSDMRDVKPRATYWGDFFA